MSVASIPLPLRETIAPTDQSDLREQMRLAVDAATPIYPLGGGTSLNFGLPAKEPGLGLSLVGLNRVVDFPARDMTITVEAGIRLAELTELMRREGQRLPIDAPDAAEATLGGLIATNWFGPRIYGQGTLRDYVIGIRAIDGHATEFNAGGRVVKNVAGYDFCKLLTGSLGTLAVLSQVTLKVRPLAERSAFVSVAIDDLDQAERLLSGLVSSQATPTAIEFLAGPYWRGLEGLPREGKTGRLLTGLEGTAPEVEWMLGQLAREFDSAGAVSASIVDGPIVEHLWSELTQFSAATEPALVIKANLLSSHVTRFVAEVLAVDPLADLQAHAGNGIVIARFAQLPGAGLLDVMVKRLQPLARASSGSAIVVHSASEGELTPQAVWGPPRGDAQWMREVKRQFDPRNLLNRGRFVY